ncbi:PilZ domain-containing protein [Bremerella cremea]|uniref:PilZ domain-containing protein n=1 Tax=Bremerella cremea TaxID=1031537 RepID=UPI0031E9975A
MLETVYSQKMKLLLDRLRCRIQLPVQFADLEHRRGVLPSQSNDMRRAARVYCPGKLLIESFASLPSVPRNHQYVVGYSVDISSTGIRFLHDTELYPGEQVTLWTSAQRLTCTVIRCRRLNKSCYEVGASFVDEDPAYDSPQDVASPEQESLAGQDFLN